MELIKITLRTFPIVFYYSEAFHCSKKIKWYWSAVSHRRGLKCELWAHLDVLVTFIDPDSLRRDLKIPGVENGWATSRHGCN